jgi:hypothetical protein
MLSFLKGFFIYWDVCAVYVELYLYPWNETNLTVVYDLLTVLMNLISTYFIENIYLYVHQGKGLKTYLFFVMSLFGFRHDRMSLIEVSCLFILWNSLRGIDISSLKTWWNLALNLYRPGLFFIFCCCETLYTASITLLVISCWLNFGSPNASRNLTISSIFSSFCLGRW